MDILFAFSGHFIIFSEKIHSIFSAKFILLVEKRYKKIVFFSDRFNMILNSLMMGLGNLILIKGKLK